MLNKNILNKKNVLNLMNTHADIAILPIAFVFVLVLMTILSSGKFLSTSTIHSIAFQSPELGLFTLAIMISMVTGGIDLSIISIANLASVIMALCLKKFIPVTGMESSSVYFYMFVVILLGVVVSLVLGLINGIFIAYIEVSPILTTLGTMIFYEGLTLAITKGYVISDFPEAFLKIGGGTFLGIPIPFLIFIFFACVLYVVFKYRPIGKYFFMIGSNKIATEYSGIDVRQVLLKAYLLSACYAGLAGIVMLSRFNSANARYGYSYLLLSALLSIMGGTDPEGGSGKVAGVVMAVIVLQMITSGLNLLGVTSFVAVALWGALLIGVMFYRHYIQNLKKNKK